MTTAERDGVLVVDKPSGPTSFGVVRQVRAALHVKKIGHGGTLDPMASGVLPLCLGEATKVAAFLLDADKDYQATLRFGLETDTHDAQGRVTAERPLAGLDEAAVRAALEAFRGPQRQVPPMVSALKRDGKPLYEYARAGQEVERAPRAITIHELTLVAFRAPDEADLRVRCSKGTYVRVLAFDLGRALGPGAHLAALRRTRSGPFTLRASLPLDEVLARAREGRALPLVSPADALAHLPSARLDGAAALAVGQGKALAWAATGLPPDLDGPARLLRPDGTLLAVVARGDEGGLRILRGFNA